MRLHAAENAILPTPEDRPDYSDQARGADGAPPRAVRPQRGKRLLRVIVGVAVLAGGAGALVTYQPWTRLSASPSGDPGPGGPPGPGRHSGPSPVAVATAITASVPVIYQGLGTVTPLNTVTVRSRISGYLTRVTFTEGQAVKAGDLLAEIDCRTYEATATQIEGELKQAQAQLENARLDLQRYQKLRAQDSIAKQNVDTQAATVQEYEGAVAASQGKLDAAKVDVSDCRITAPISGRVGLRKVDAGNYVTAGDSTGIAVVTQLQPIAVLFTLPEDQIGLVASRMQSGASLPVTAYDRANLRPVADGHLASIDNQIDTSTGTVKLKAEFPNTDGLLFPNQFVNAHLKVDTLSDVVVVPSAAVQYGTPGSFVYKVQPDHTVALQVVQTGISDDERTVITAGLASGDVVVVDGVDRLRSGASVNVRMVDGKPVGTESAGKRRVERPAS